MTTYQKIQKILIFLIILFTIIVIGLTIGVVINNDNTNFSDYLTWEACRKALFSFTAFDSASILGLILILIFKENINTTK